MIDATARVRDYVHYGERLSVGAMSILGAEQAGNSIVIGCGVSIGCHCVIHDGARIGDNVEIDHYCRVSARAMIGNGSKILYGTQIFSRAKTGENCIVGGNLSERVVLEDDVTFMGEVAHSHRNAQLDWDTTDEPSPYIERGAVVGVGALLVGGIRVGRGAYIAVREVVKADVPPFTVVMNGQRMPISKFRGFLRSRLDPPQDG